MTPPEVLYHYTCSHGAEGIGRQGLLKPRRHPLLPGLPPVVWLNDLEVPDRDALGLTSTILDCDRTQHRYTVRVRHAPAFQWWPEVRDSGRYALDPVMVAMLEFGRRPEHWWLSVIHLQAVRSPAAQLEGEVGR